MILTGKQKATLKEAIVKAYREEELEVLLAEKMEVSYGAIAQGDTYTNRVAFLIGLLEAEGKVEQFIRVIVENKPDSPYLEQLKKLREIEKIPSNQGDYSSTPVDRNELLNILKGLIPAQFSELVFVLNAPDEYLPGQNTPQSEKAIALLKWASAPSGIGLDKIRAALDTIINPSVVVPSTKENLKGNSQVMNNARVTEWKIVLDGELSDLSLDKQEQIINTLKEIGRDSSLKLKKIEQGSIVLLLEGSEECYKVIQALYEQGILTEIHSLPILKVENIKSISQKLIDDQGFQKSIANHQINTSKVPKMHILHLSDLHFATLEQALLWSNQLVQDLKNELSISSIDALILSGDIADKSTQGEYEAAQEFLNSFRQDFPLAAEQIIIVPGNHDLNRDKSEQAYTPVRRRNYNGRTTTLNGEKQPDPNYAIDNGGDYVEQQDEDKYKERFTYFSEFYQVIKNVPYPLDYDKQYTLEHFPTRNLLILGLNSAWQLDHHYRSRASINMNALSNALTEIRRNQDYENCLKIAVWHHPLDSAGNDRITDQGFIEQLAVAGFRFFLHGHIHKAETSLYRYDMSANGRKLDRICAGTFGAATRERVPGYPWQYNLLKFEANLLTVETRRREQESGAWKPDARWSQGAGTDPLPRYTIAIPEYALEPIKK